jgi:uncharacterized damage-inducible protein DinB
MNINTCLRASAYNNAWANYRLLSACAQLDGAALAMTRTSFFPSIIRTLNHILTVDWFYVSALEGDSMGTAAFDPEIPCPALEDLSREQGIVDRRLIGVCEQLADADVDRIVDIKRDTRIQRETAGRTLLHLFQHQIHHRGQVHAMLSGTHIAPPQLDEFFLGDTREQSFRQADFASLGFTEEQIWR